MWNLYRQSAEGMDYVTVQRPQALNADMGDLPWPVFKFSQFITWASSTKAEDAARSFLESLHPEGPLHSRTAKCYNDTDVIQKKSDGTWQSDGHSEWCVSYARSVYLCVPDGPKGSVRTMTFWLPDGYTRRQSEEIFALQNYEEIPTEKSI
jgi:hypothetical protein